LNDFDIVVDDKFGVIKGDDRVVFIKTGAGGSIYGYENKYLNIARKIRDKYGFTVIISANPTDSFCILEDEIERVIEIVGWCNDIIYVGISNGALIGAQQCNRVWKVSHALLINAPLMINWYKTKAGAERFEGKCMHFVYGGEDSSARYIELIDCIDNDRCDYELLDSIGHNLSESELEQIVDAFLCKK
jgi:hypothetical protein